MIAEDYDEHGTTDLQQNYVHNKHGGKLVTEDTKAVSDVSNFRSVLWHSLLLLMGLQFS